ncbi:short chain dehydrogenase [Punctularia strigosozonata HHB-11173 SS5]|uniref:Short chain dehydrogenase n=1 Tax=Punctularia strigosozonata (strain HHB-11173) TaxID=741275 RepID=R7S3W8_PUNST|nr:short chain dehydrogenase [Punctularia strigosozonata HHB-11173 SS5]EIN04903.1 short chain dehydrogenase [Punctularia strigosozonata HHB-11173 SS5]
MSDKLRGKRVVIVGGSSGIGFGVAKLALTAGASVIISSSNQTKVDAAVKRLVDLDVGGPVEGKVLDVKGGESAVKAFFEALPEFNHLIWTAGDFFPLNYPNGDLTGVQDTFVVRTLGPIYAGKYAPSRMPKSSDSSIILTCGSVSRKPSKGMAIGAAVSGATERFAKGLAVELAPIRVNAVSPGAVQTELWDALPAESVQALLSTLTQKLLVQHVADADEAAEPYLYLMRSAYVTGEVVNVDGGAVLA